MRPRGTSSRLRRCLERAPRRTAIVAVSAISVLLLVAFAVLLGEGDRAGRENLEERAVQRTVIAERFVEAANADLQASIRTHAHLALTGPAPSAAEFTLVNEMLRFRAGVLLDEDGRVLQTFPTDEALVGEDLTARYDHLEQAIAGETAITGVVPSAVAGDPIVAFAVPYDTEEGRRVFSAGYQVKDSPLGAYLANSTVLAGEALYLVDRLGVIIAASEDTAAATLAEQDPALAAAVADRVQGTFTDGGTDRYASTATIGGAPWRLVRVLPSEVLYAPADHGRWISWLLLAACVLAGLASIVMLSWIMAERDTEHRRAGRDPLTDLVNRRSLDAELTAPLVGSRSGARAVLMIDVDHFKAVNDQHGHRVGDQVLIGVARAIADSVRPGDLVGRWGGEEFMVVVADASLLSAGVLAERIRAAVAARRTAGVGVTVSIGYASSETTPSDGLVDLADASLYRAKESGRDRCRTLGLSDAFPVLAAVSQPLR